MDPVDDFITQQTPGLKIYQKVWGGMQCAYHCFAPGTDFTALLAPMPDHLCTVPHHAYVISGSMKVIYKDGSLDGATLGTCAMAAPHNFISEEARRSSEFSGSGALAAQAKVVEDLIAKGEEVGAHSPRSESGRPWPGLSRRGRPGPASILEGET